MLVTEITLFWDLKELHSRTSKKLIINTKIVTFYPPSEFTPALSHKSLSQPLKFVFKILTKASFKGKTSTKTKTKNLIMLPKT